MKKLKLDETGDSDDLQALFDSIASEAPQKVRLEVVPEAANNSGDCADLEALSAATLRDLNINPGEINRIARVAVYGAPKVRNTYAPRAELPRFLVNPARA